MTAACPSTLGAVKPTLAGAVVVDGGAADDGVDRVAVLERVRQALERHESDAAGHDRAPRVRVERAAVAVGREDAALLVDVAEPAGSLMYAPPARARSHSPVSRLWTARWTATADVEQAVFTLTAGPSSPSWYAARVMAYSRSVASSSGHIADARRGARDGPGGCGGSTRLTRDASEDADTSGVHARLDTRPARGPPTRSRGRPGAGDR